LYPLPCAVESIRAARLGLFILQDAIGQVVGLSWKLRRIFFQTRLTNPPLAVDIRNEMQSH